MADPLSLTASIIAVAGVAAKVGKTLQTFYRATDEALLLQNELTDLEVLLQTSESLCEQEWKPEQQGLLNQATVLLERIKAQLNRLNGVLEPQSRFWSSPKAKRLAWVRNQYPIHRLQDEYRSARQRLIETFHLLDTATSRRTVYQVDELKVQLDSLQDSALSRQDVLLTRVADVEKAIAAVALQSQDGSAVSRAATTPPAYRQGEYITGNSSAAPVSVTCSVVRPGEDCSAWCSCSCHRISFMSTPTMLEQLVGQMLVGYSVKPWVRKKCDEKSCTGSSRSAIRLVYVSPAWFLARSISVLITTSDVRGPELLLRIPRVRSHVDPIWSSVYRGDLDFVKAAFSTGLAHIDDVTDIAGQSLLHVRLPLPIKRS